MKTQNKMFGSKHFDAVPQHILDQRIDQTDSRETNRRTTKFILGTAAVFAALALIGKETVDQNRAHSAHDSTPIEHVSAGNSS